eukprot:CCRYP_006384-RB/>CCRYP_006384-RB protein AED:0.04 eAED:0.04 QI:66/1/1/1/0.75/0.6/5/189/1059
MHSTSFNITLFYVVCSRTNNVGTKGIKSFKKYGQSVIFNNTDNALTVGQTPAVTCLNSAITSTIGPDVLHIPVDKWRSGGLFFGCQSKDASWACIKTCYYQDAFGNTPNFSKYGYLTFLARVTGQNGACQPKMKVAKRYPVYSSAIITLSGKYVDKAALVGSEYRQVVIPVADLISKELCGGILCWPVLTDVATIWFLSCGTDFTTQPIYDIKNLVLTDQPPLISNAPPTSMPTFPPPTNQPTSYPTSSPTPLPDSKVFATTADAFTVGQATALSCLATPGSPENTAVIDPNVLQIAPDKWHAAGLYFGCREKNSSWACVKSCYYQGKFGNMPNFSKYSYLTFKAKVSDHDSECSLSIHLSKYWPVYYSKPVRLSGPYVDAGELSGEWRKVVIPTNDLVSQELCDGVLCWPSLNDVSTLWFDSCSSALVEYPVQPVYQISNLTLTNYPPKLLSQPPTLSPTPYVTMNPSLATHRLVDCSDTNHQWYPIFESEREPDNVWLIASNNEWPKYPQTSRAVTVHVPIGQTVTYHEYNSLKYDKVIIEGTLNIKPLESDVKLTVGTLLVEKTGYLNISTSTPEPYTVTIEIDGMLNREVDPEETMVGLVSLAGSVTVSGNSIPVKWSSIALAVEAGSVSVELLGIDAATYWVVGDEIVFPDTKEGRNVAHWNFPKNEGGYVDQTELRKIAALSINDDDNTVIILDRPLLYRHAGCNVVHVTRSINFVTSHTSNDRGHIMHTGGGSFSFQNTRIENFGRTSVQLIDSTAMKDADIDLAAGLAQMNVIHQGSNQVGRYALHAHHSMVEVFFKGNAILFSPRNGIVAHNSRVHILENIVVGANGSAIFLEDSTETGPVMNNFLIGNGGGTRGGDDGRFAIKNGTDMGHGGFGIWARGGYCHIENNRAEGSFGLAPYAFFVHPNFVSDKLVPNVTGTPEFLIGKSSHQLGHELDHDLTIQSFGSFKNNSARGTWRNGLDLSYFGAPKHTLDGHILVNVELIALAQSGYGAFTIHSKVFTMRGGIISGAHIGNTITGVFCNSCDNCTLNWIEEDGADISGVGVIRGGNC